MVEVAAVVAIIVGLLGLAAVPAGSGIVLGGAVALASLGVGTVAGIVYHVLLHRVLSPRGALGRGWIWQPTNYHKHLSDTERVRVLPWFYVGAAGAAFSIYGCLMVVTSVVRSIA